jgi:hypothetical protein
MQYLLSEAEYKALLKAKDEAEKAVKNKVQELCTMVADHMPVGPHDWQQKDAQPEPWGCIITRSKMENTYEGYCDECPVQKLCPCGFKNWSK